MVKPADARGLKYAAKFDATVVASRYTALKDLATREAGIAFAQFAQLEATVKASIENSVPSPTLLPFYLSCARQLQSKANKYSGLALWNEAQAVKTVWVGRLLDGTIIDTIMGIVGITTGVYS